MEAVYYKIGSYELGIVTTGKRTSNYSCWCEIYGKNGDIIKDHYLSDVYYGKWPKCQPVINKWKKLCEKVKLVNKPLK